MFGTTDRIPLIFEAAAGKPGLFEEATARPMLGMTRCSVPPAAAIWLASWDGSALPVAEMMYDLGAAVADEMAASDSATVVPIKEILDFGIVVSPGADLGVSSGGMRSLLRMP
jgi:hypothetical protein